MVSHQPRASETLESYEVRSADQKGVSQQGPGTADRVDCGKPSCRLKATCFRNLWVSATEAGMRMASALVLSKVTAPVSFSTCKQRAPAQRLVP